MNMGHSIGGTSQATLVDSLINAGVLVTPRVIELLAAHLQPGHRAIDVGCGSGYLAAVMATLVGPTGHVTGVDIVPSLVEFSTANVTKAGVACNFTWTTSSGKEILALTASFDGIHVGVAVESMDQVDALATHLNPGGALVVPLGYAASEQLLLKERVMSVLCQPLLDQAPAPLPVPETRSDKVARLQAALEAWKVSFVTTHDRAPTREDILQDDIARRLFADFAATRK
ncbi:hypothetical protein DYB37_009344 [Aphanomyces astaci]|uniref:protein-L-isoaspartate(D-aspartate) O-methyltransferase n=1 Tax=Aphanomyces astaci TaxID=112090 RepID=A0A3R6Y3S3_APHAT|nr:hypothetical protein DYB35_011597 [Aphanomyces astaci]RHZ17269.1 hypothetical protein DYB37_009344 [Aphanomyces astaci]